MLYQGANFSATEQMNWRGLELHTLRTLRNRTSNAQPSGGARDPRRTLRNRTTQGGGTMRQGRAAAGFGGEGLSRMNMHWGVGWILAAATAAQGYWWLDWHDLHESVEQSAP